MIVKLGSIFPKFRDEHKTYLSCHQLVKDLKSVGEPSCNQTPKAQQLHNVSDAVSKKLVVLSWISPPKKKQPTSNKGKTSKKRKNRKVANLKGKKLVQQSQSLTAKAPEKFPFPNRKEFFQSPFLTWRIIPV